jgi:hypothetical protein
MDFGQDTDDEYLWGTVYEHRIYCSDGYTGRGIFHFSIPFLVDDLAYGNNYLWAVGKMPTNGGDNSTIYKINVKNSCLEPVQYNCRYRDFELCITSVTDKSVICNAKHVFAVPQGEHEFPNQYRPEGTSWGTFECESLDFDVDLLYYRVGNDVNCKQFYNVMTFGGVQLDPDTEITTSCRGKLWTSYYRHYVYPHLCNYGTPPGDGYLDDDYDIYGWSDPDDEDARDQFKWFKSLVHEYIEEEYGSYMAETTNPYWIARNILEVIREKYHYGNTMNISKGHYGYNPVFHKIKLLTDSINENDKMSCSPSAFTEVAMCRWEGVPARWVGTSIWEGKWDTNPENDYIDEGEFAEDFEFHRWAHVWMGNNYGWQRFDATPSPDNCCPVDERTQYLLMSSSCQEIDYHDVVLTIGSGLEFPFVDDIYKNQGVPSPYGSQRYNVVSKYESPGKWNWSDEIREWSVRWYNARFIKPEPVSVSGDRIATVEWELKGDWSSSFDDCPGCNKTLVIKLLKDGLEREKAEIIKYVDAHDLKTNIDVSTLPEGLYTFLIELCYDRVTGCETGKFDPTTKTKNHISIILRFLENHPYLYSLLKSLLDLQ